MVQTQTTGRCSEDIICMCGY